jgi:hypothetical protein
MKSLHTFAVLLTGIFLTYSPIGHAASESFQQTPPKQYRSSAQLKKSVQDINNQAHEAKKALERTVLSKHEKWATSHPFLNCIIGPKTTLVSSGFALTGLGILSTILSCYYCHPAGTYTLTDCDPEIMSASCGMCCACGIYSCSSACGYSAATAEIARYEENELKNIEEQRSNESTPLFDQLRELEHKKKLALEVFLEEQVKNNETKPKTD